MAQETGDLIDISGLDKYEVTAALHAGTHSQGLGVLHDTGALTADELRTAFPDGIPEYFDYLRGRVMKVGLTKDSFNPRGYDMDNYPGAAADVIARLREAAK